MDAETVATFEELFEGQKEIIVDPSALERKFTIPERNRSMVREFRKVLEEVFTSNDGVKRYPLDGKTIVFAVNKRHAETLAQMFDQEFADKKPSPDVRYADFVVSDSGADDTIDAYTKIKRFKNEEYPKILVSVNMLDTGFDCPEVVNLVMARFTKSAIPAALRMPATAHTPAQAVSVWLLVRRRASAGSWQKAAAEGSASRATAIWCGTQGFQRCRLASTGVVARVQASLAGLLQPAVKHTATS
jgi:hypothetical protein